MRYLTSIAQLDGCSFLQCVPIFFNENRPLRPCFFQNIFEISRLVAYLGAPVTELFTGNEAAK